MTILAGDLGNDRISVTLKFGNLVRIEVARLDEPRDCIDDGIPACCSYQSFNIGSAHRMQQGSYRHLIRAIYRPVWHCMVRANVCFRSALGSSSTT